MQNIDLIVKGKFKKNNPNSFGTFHKIADLPKRFSGWNSNIKQEIARLKKIEKQDLQEKLDLIDQIEKVRNANNVNWMDLLRLSFKSSPQEAKDLIKRINSDDNKISDLFKRLGN